jgi:energy-coupling factor transporter ATP-binding protein EcfA2
MPRIKTLTVKDFRGIREATLSFDGRCIVLLGENGAGKSSFVDALEFFFAGKVSHLEGAQGVSTSRHAPHIRATPEDTIVEVEFDHPSDKVTRTFAGLSSIPETIKDYLALGANSTFILRRKNLLDFILAQPAPRYEQLAAIIGVSDLDKTERALMQARDDLLAQREAIERQIQAEEKKLHDLLDSVVKNDEQILVALNLKLLALQQSPLGSLSEAETRKVAAVTRSRSPQDTQRAVKVQNMATLASSLRNASGLAEGYHKLWVAVEQLQQNAAQIREILFQEVLASGRRLIKDYGLDYCPVCLHEIERDVLLASLEKRIRDAEEIARKAADIKRLQTQVVEQIREQIVQAERLAAQASESQIPLDGQPLSQYTGWLNSVLTALQPEPIDMRLVLPGVLAQSPEATAFAASVDSLLITLQSEKERLEPTEQDQQAVAVIDLLTRVMDSRQVLLNLRPRWAAKADTCKEMAAIYDCFVNTKRTEVQAIYSELESDIERFFKYLHINEGYGGVRLAVQEDRRASTEIKVDFHERQQEDPRAFNSEGHLDSLGLCVFLAFVKRFNAGFPLIALDDVVSSIDSSHRQQICGLLFQEFGDYQFFITTHDYVWFEELCAHQRAYNRTDHFVNIQILGWSLDTGPRLDNYRPRWERTADKLAKGDKDGAAADARKALEAFLYEMVMATLTPIALRHDGRYVVGDLHPPFVSRIKKLVPDVHQTNLVAFQALETNVIFGNLLVHNNPKAANASLEEVQGFVSAVQGIEALFTCPQCERHVSYYRDAKVMKCHCGNILWQTKG